MKRNPPHGAEVPESFSYTSGKSHSTIEGATARKHREGGEWEMDNASLAHTKLRLLGVVMIMSMRQRIQ